MCLVLLGLEVSSHLLEGISINVVYEKILTHTCIKKNVRVAAEFETQCIIMHLKWAFTSSSMRAVFIPVRFKWQLKHVPGYVSARHRYSILHCNQDSPTSWDSHFGSESYCLPEMSFKVQMKKLWLDQQSVRKN